MRVELNILLMTDDESLVERYTLNTGHGHSCFRRHGELLYGPMHELIQTQTPLITPHHTEHSSREEHECSEVWRPSDQINMFLRSMVSSTWAHAVLSSCSHHHSLVSQRGLSIK